MKIPPGVHLLFFYGTHHDEILHARDQAVDALVPPEFRNENVTSYGNSGQSDRVSLASLMDELSGDLATMSFFPGAAKVAIVTNPAEIFGADEGDGAPARGKKAAADQQAMLHWIEHELPATGNFLLLLAFEDEAAGRTIQEKRAGKLFQLATSLHSFPLRFGDSKALYRLEDAFLARDLNTCLSVLREFWNSKSQSQSIVFNRLVGMLRFAMQANIARDRGLSLAQAAQSPLFPAGSQGNLFKMHPVVQKKYGPPRYRTADLLRMHQRLVDVYRALRPRPGDVYVADAQVLLEQALVELFRSPPPRR